MPHRTGHEWDDVGQQPGAPKPAQGASSPPLPQAPGEAPAAAFPIGDGGADGSGDALQPAPDKPVDSSIHATEEPHWQTNGAKGESGGSQRTLSEGVTHPGEVTTVMAAGGGGSSSIKDGEPEQMEERGGSVVDSDSKPHGVSVRGWGPRFYVGLL